VTLEYVSRSERMERLFDFILVSDNINSSERIALSVVTATNF
jgi:hypothetical protein